MVQRTGSDTGSRADAALPVIPDAEYLLVASRMMPDDGGGFGLAVPRRARDLAAAGARVQLLTPDPSAALRTAGDAAEFTRRGYLRSPEQFRNLYHEAIADPSWLRAAARAGQVRPGLEYRPIGAPDRPPVVSLPVIPNDPDWYTSRAPILVHDDAGEVLGVLDGFAALYRVWLDHVIDGVDGPVVVLTESRQIGELLGDWDNQRAYLVNPIHTHHLTPPYTPDAPVNAGWQRWFDMSTSFDAVLWPTRSQRDDATLRFGDHGTSAVVPHPVAAATDVVPAAARDAHRAVMVNRLAPGKRVDHAVRAWRTVRETLPDAVLDVYGDGAEQAALQALIDELGLTEAVHLHGFVADPTPAFRSGAVFVQTSAYEGQGMSLAEALAQGQPVVAYDVSYGPRDMLTRDGDERGGLLVPSGDEEALAAAIIRVLSDDTLRARLSAEALEQAGALTVEASLEAFATAMRRALQMEPRRLSH